MSHQAKIVIMKQFQKKLTSKKSNASPKVTNSFVSLRIHSFEEEESITQPPSSVSVIRTPLKDAACFRQVTSLWMKSRGEDQNEDRQSKVLARESLRLGWSLLPLTLREDIPSSFRRHAERVSGVQWLVSSGSWPAMWETQSRRGHVCSDLGPGLRSAARGSCIQACASAHSSPTFPPSSRDQQSPWLKSTASCRDDARQHGR